MSGKFTNVKEGDTLYRRVSVGESWGIPTKLTKVFTIPLKVTRTTATQFTLDNGERYKKDSGRGIGSSNHFTYLSWEGMDQTEQRNEYARGLNIINRVNQRLVGISLTDYSYDKALSFSQDFMKLMEELDDESNCCL